MRLGPHEHHIYSTVFSTSPIPSVSFVCTVVYVAATAHAYSLCFSFLYSLHVDRLRTSSTGIGGWSRLKAYHATSFFRTMQVRAFRHSLERSPIVRLTTRPSATSITALLQSASITLAVLFLSSSRTSFRY